MKKIFSGFMMAAAALFVTSCASDELTSSQTGGEATVSFSLALEDGIDTRVISDGSGADVLMYAVFDEDGKRISGISKVEKTGVTFPTVENITLAKGQTYKIAFWAQDEDCKAYTVSDDMNVSIDYTGVNNDETRDAFFKSIEFTVSGSASLDVVLKRPFAQINVGVYQEDWDAAVASGIEIANSVAYIKNAATSINLLNGMVGEETTDVPVEYTAAAIPTESLMVDVDKDGTKEAYKWLSMSYILVADHGTTPNNDGIYGAAATTLNDLGFSFVPVSGNAITFAQGLKSVPVERNWRTNIIGKILTGDIEFNISIDPIYDGDYIYPDGIAQQLEFAATFGGSVTLNEDATIEESLVVQPGVDMVINLNGHKLTNSSTSTEIGEGDGIIVYGNLTIDGEGEVSAKTRTVWARGENAHVTIKGGKFVGADANTEVIYASGANSVIDIYGGEFEALQQSTSFAAPQYAVLNLYGNGNNGCDINVFGGKFKNFNPSDNVSENPKKNFVEEGYVSIAEGEYFSVVPGKFVTSAEDFKAALADENIDNIILTSDVNLGTDITAITTDKVIKGNGNKITAGGGSSSKSYGLQIANSANVVIEDVKMENCGGMYVSDGGNLTVKDVTMKTTYSASGRHMFYVNNGVLNVESGTFEVLRTKSRYIVLQNNAKAYVKGGTWADMLSSGYDPVYADTGGELAITGGKFQVNVANYKFDPTPWVPAGYKTQVVGNYMEVLAE